MSTITIQATFNDKDFSVFQSLFKKYKVKTQIITQEKDNTEMSKTEFLEKIDRASKGNFNKISRAEMSKMLLGNG